VGLLLVEKSKNGKRAYWIKLLLVIFITSLVLDLAFSILVELLSIKPLTGL
jgi:hypothetical protein